MNHMAVIIVANEIKSTSLLDAVIDFGIKYEGKDNLTMDVCFLIAVKQYRNLEMEKLIGE